MAVLIKVEERPDSMSRRNIKPTTFHDDSRSSDAGSVVNALPSRSKTRTNRDPAKDLLALREHRVDVQLNNGMPSANIKPPPIGPDGEIQVDFSALPIEALQKYKHHFNLPTLDPPPTKKPRGHNHGKKRHRDESEDELSNSDDDSPYRIDLGAWRPRINKPDLARAARAHFSNLPQARENESIVQFLYAVKTQDKVLKLRPDN